MGVNLRRVNGDDIMNERLNTFFEGASSWVFDRSHGVASESILGCLFLVTTTEQTGDNAEFATVRGLNPIIQSLCALALPSHSTRGCFLTLSLAVALNDGLVFVDSVELINVVNVPVVRQ